MTTMTEEDVDLSGLIDEDNEKNHFKRMHISDPPTEPGSIAIAECGALYRVKGHLHPGVSMKDMIDELCPDCVAAIALD